jgi:hypothetical protein
MKPHQRLLTMHEALIVHRYYRASLEQAVGMRELFELTPVALGYKDPHYEREAERHLKQARLTRGWMLANGALPGDVPWPSWAGPWE